MLPMALGTNWNSLESGWVVVQVTRTAGWPDVVVPVVLGVVIVLVLANTPWGNERVGVSATGELSRGDFGMSFNQALGSGNMLVSDKVKLSIDVSAVKAA